jgi:hypothetical protein
MHPFPYAAPSTGGFIGNSLLGVRQGCRTLLEGQESLPASPDKNDGAQEVSGIGRISFGYFSLSAQRKVSRLPVRELAFNQ